MYIKEYMNLIKDELKYVAKYWELSRCAKNKNETEASQYLSKMALDKIGHITILFKMLDNCITKNTTGKEYQDVYKEIFEESLEMLKDEQKSLEDKIKRNN